MKNHVLRGLIFCSLAIALSANVAFGTDEVTKTWELTIPDGDTGCTNNAPVTLSDGNYTLRAWIDIATNKTLGIGGGNSIKDNEEAKGLAMLKDADGNWIGSGDLDLRGTITIGGVESPWKIVKLGKGSFSTVRDAPFNTCYCPTTVTSFATHTFQMCGVESGLDKLVINAPGLKQIPNNTFLAPKVNGQQCRRGPKILDLQVPGMTSICGYWPRNGYDDFLSDTDVSTWDLSSVQKIVRTDTSKKYLESHLFRWGSFRGTMRLPSLVWLNRQTFEHNRNMTALEIGRNNKLEYVGTLAVTDCEKLGSITLGGKSTGWVVSTNAFYTANITNVTFLSVPPTFEEPDSVIFGTEETPALQIAFYIPRKDSRGWWANWGRIARAARPVTETERALFTSRFGAAAAQGLVGIVSPEIFRTKNEQWLVCGVPPTERFSVNVALLDPRFDGDKVSISPEPDADGRYAAGTEVTFTAEPNEEKGQFVRWRGAGISEEVETQNPLKIFVDRDMTVTAQIAHDWVFRLNNPDTTAWNNELGTISNQIWKLNVKANGTKSSGKIFYGKYSEGTAWTEMGEGMLDLNGRILMENADGTKRELNLYNVPNKPFVNKSDKGVDYIDEERYPRAIILRENFPVYYNQSYRNRNSNCIVTNFIFECPYELTDKDGKLVNMGDDDFCYFQLTSSRLRLPKVKQLFRTHNYNWKLAESVDVSDWRLDSVTNVGEEVSTAWGTIRGPFSTGEFTGTLHLPAISDIQAKGFINAVNMDAIELGSNTTVRVIRSQAFSGCSSLGRIQLRAGKDLTVAANAFTGTTKLKMLEFTYEVPTDPVAVDNMLVGTTESVAESSNPPVIYASRLMGWNSSVSRIRAATPEEEAACPAWLKNAKITGVWVTADSVAKAWVVHAPSNDDPVGVLIIIR